MLTEANRHGLVFDTRLLARYLGSGSSAVRHDSLTVLYRALNLLSRTRTTVTRKGRRFRGSWRRLDPPPEANTRQQDEAYVGPNVVEYAEQTDRFAERVTDVVALPEPAGAVDAWLAAHGVDLGAPPAR